MVPEFEYYCIRCKELKEYTEYQIIPLCEKCWREIEDERIQEQ